MKNYKKIKTFQLVAVLVLVLFILTNIFTNFDLYHVLAGDAKNIFIFFWILALLSFLFLIYDFSVYNQLKKKYGEIDMALYSDSLTGLGNRSSLDAYIESYKGKELPPGVGAITFRVTGIVEINQQYGNEEGDRIIKTFSNILASNSKNRAFVGRNGGNNFLVLFKDATETDIEWFLSFTEAEVSDFNERTKGASLTYAAGYALHKDEDITITELVATSYRNSMEKNNGETGQ